MSQKNEQIFNKLKDINILDENGYPRFEYKHVENPPYMDFSVELLNFKSNDYIKAISIGHTREQNGDLMYEPMMEIAIYPHENIAYGYMYQNDNICAFYVSTFDDEGYPSDNEMIEDMNSFLDIWLDNLKAQGFAEKID